MKDRQFPTQGPLPSIPILSPLLHWLAMPVLVFLRSGFGYSFLSPKSVFLSFVYASAAFCIYAWLEPGAWSKYWAGALFAGGASLLYTLHLVTAVLRETQKTGKHDYYSGTSHLLRLPGFAQQRGNTRFGTLLHLWIEPAIVFVAATALRGFMSELRLSSWLLFVVAAMWLKEFINYWYGLRSEKKHGDIMDDAMEKMPAGGSGAGSAPPGAGGRKPRAKRPPNAMQSTDGQDTEQRHAETLRLMPPRPPYDLEQAEQNYRELMKAVHPDTNADTAEQNEKAARLNEAIEFFRGRIV